MSYLDESGLFTYDSNLKEWISSQESKTITSSIYPWTKTAKAGAVSCYPVGGTELKPVVDFLFTEIPPTSGDKGPDNPSTISGVSSVNMTRCGKNIALLPFITSSETSDRLTFTNNGDGSITINGTATSNSYFLFRRNVYLHAGTTLSINAEFSGTTGEGIAIQIISRDNLYPIIWQYLNMTNTIKMIPEDGYATLRLYVGKSTSLSNAVIKPQYEFGDAKTVYEAPILASEADYTINLGNTYYGGSIDLATGVMTVTHIYKTISEVNACDSLSGNFANPFVWPTTLGEELRGNVIKSISACSALEVKTANGDSERIWLGGFNASANMRPINFSFLMETVGVTASQTNTEKKNACNAYLSENPIYVVLELTNPQIVQLSPVSISALSQQDKYTPRLNTVYSDQKNVQVGYIKSPIRNEFGLRQAIVAQGGNI